MEIVLTKDQQRVYDRIMDFLKTGGDLLTIGGYGGTGKTTTIGITAADLKKELGLRLACVALSGKASSVLRDKMNGVLDNRDYCGTIHGLIYRIKNSREVLTRHNEVKSILEWETKTNNLDYDVIIIDEASMVNETIFKDLSRFGIPIIAVGDHGQLPPVGGNFSLMEFPDITLEVIMRQVADNPIIKVATMARLDGHIPYGEYGPGVKKIDDFRATREHPYGDMEAILLCYTNKTRVSFIRQAREILGLGGLPQEGEPIICLLNNIGAGIFNGNIGTVIEASVYDDALWNLKAQIGEIAYEGLTDADQWWGYDTGPLLEGIDRFTWAYAATVHKAQGSEWRRVTVFEEKLNHISEENWRRWLYTAVSRAKEELVIIG